MLRHRASPPKLVQAIAFFASKSLRDLTSMKLAKLLYFADKAHLLRYGRTITSDQYFCMDHGPVPSMGYDLMKGVLGAGGILTRALHDFVAAHADEGHLPVFQARRPPDLSVFSESDIEVLEEIARTLGPLTASALRHRAHLEPEVKEAAKCLKAGSSVPIPDERFLLSAPPEEAQSLRALLEEEAENRFLAEAL